ncbi:MAG: hypothetical protein NC319_03610 [Butyricicoccus sp.]|nr:hypothetical protein [Butyricicoccus sp.]
MADDREYSNIYTIPPNYTDSGKLLGGMLETRNTVEAGILLGLNRHNNSLCIVDPFNTKVNKNANFTICGTSGADQDLYPVRHHP